MNLVSLNTFHETVCHLRLHNFQRKHFFTQLLKFLLLCRLLVDQVLCILDRYVHKNIAIIYCGLKSTIFTARSMCRSTQDHSRGCSSPSLRPLSLQVIEPTVCDARLVQRQTYSYGYHHRCYISSKLYCLVTEVGPYSTALSFEAAL